MLSWIVNYLKYIPYFLSYAVHRTPYHVRLLVANFLVFIWLDLFRIRKKIILDNLGIAFPELSKAEKMQIARRYLRMQAMNIIEYFDFPFLQKDNKDLFEVKGREHLDAALKQGRGVFLLSLHLGNPDLGILGLAVHGFPMSLVSKEMTIQWLNRWWWRLRARFGTEVIPPRNSSYAILKSLKRQRVIGFVLDQYTGKPIGCKVKFFGRETGATMGLAMMVSRSKAPVVPGYIVRKPDGRFAVMIEPEIPYEELVDRDQSLVHMTQKYTDWIEGVVRAYPDQWMWLHRRWKTFRD